jgi:general secretion pathway protein C
MIARLSAFVIWSLVAAATVFWGLRLLVRPSPPPVHALVVSESSAARGDLSRLFGAAAVTEVAVAPAASSRFKLMGVMAGRAGEQGASGIALISIDGKPARAFVAGSKIEDQLVLQNVSLRSASVGSSQGAASFVLELPSLPPPATGTLPRAMPDTPGQSAPVAAQIPQAAQPAQIRGGPPMPRRSPRPAASGPAPN